MLADTRAAADSPARRAARDGAIDRIGTSGWGTYLDRSLPRLLAPDAPRRCSRARGRWPRRAASGSSPGWRRCAIAPTAPSELAAIRCPTLVIAGARDQVVPADEMRGMSGAIAGRALRRARRARPPGQPRSARRLSRRRWARFLDESPAREAHEAAGDAVRRVRNAAEPSPSGSSAAADRGVVLGSGLGGVADRLARRARGALRDAARLPETTVAGHPGRLVAGKHRGGHKTLLLCGRVHGYEGYPPRRSASACASPPRSACDT